MEFHDDTRVVLLRRQCGTCGHSHALTDCDDSECKCLGWTATDAERDEINEREHRELVELGGARTWLTAEVSVRLLDTLADVEQRIDSCLGWDIPPVVLTVSITDSSQWGGDFGDTIGFDITSLKVDSSFWAQYDNPLQTMNALAAKAAARPSWFRAFRTGVGLDPDDPVVAWAWCVEGYAKRVIDGRVSDDNRDETRTVAAVDVDGRVYTVTRFRKSGEVVQREVHTLPAHLARLEKGLGDSHPIGLLPGHRAVAQLVAIECAEMARPES